MDDDVSTEDFVAAFGDVHLANDQHGPLWDSRLEQLEFWPSTSLASTAASAAQFVDWGARARRRLEREADPAWRASLAMVADLAALEAAIPDVLAELTWPNPVVGLHGFLHWAVNDFPLATAEHGDRWLDKLARFPGAVDELAGRLRAAAAMGRTRLRRHDEATVAALDELLRTPVADDPLLRQAPPRELDAAAAAAFRDAATEAVRTSVRPALAALRDVLSDTAPLGRDDAEPGIGHLPGGEATYAALLAGYVEQGATAEGLHELGLAQLEELAEAFGRVGNEAFGLTDPRQVMDRMRDDPSLHRGSADEVVADAQAMHAAAEAAAPAWFDRRPTSPCRVVAVTSGSLAFYSPPAPEDGRDGVFYLNVEDPSVWGPNLAATVFHEGVPGHHFQLALAAEDTALPYVHRQVFTPAFGEGWGLYAERLADEMGLYEGPVDRLGMLANDALRAGRLVVDTGMHALGWTRERAIAFMLANTPLPAAEVVPEVDRYIGMPGQACSYMPGRLAIEAARRDAEARLGDRFDARAFHAVVLSRGNLSLSAMRILVDSWVTRSSSD